MAILEAPSDKLVVVVLVEVILVATTLAKVVLPANEAPVATVFNVDCPETFNVPDKETEPFTVKVLETESDVFTLTDVELTIKTLELVLALNVIDVVGVTSIAGPNVFPVVRVNTVEAFAVSTFVVVILDN